MRKKKDTHSFDFRPLGLAIREAREKAGLSRNDLGDKVFYGERHLADIENIGTHPSFQLLLWSKSVSSSSTLSKASTTFELVSFPA